MAASSGRASDPLIGFNFQLEVSGTAPMTGYFTECAGIGSENEIVEHKVVDENGHELVQKIPGRLKFQDVTLKRGITADMQIWAWRALVEQGHMGDARANMSIIMLDRDYTPVARWDFINAWPSKVTGPSVKSDDNSFGVEEVTIVHEGMIRAS
ncbi:MAG: phage tail protein [Chloroflexi bacterium]|nr:phage tail protein [Chloroflexota bacterium]